jgi:hypothetical protein
MQKSSSSPIHFHTEISGDQKHFEEDFETLEDLKPEQNHLVLRTARGYYCLPVNPRQLLTMLDTSVTPSREKVQQYHFGMVACEINKKRYLGQLTISLDQEHLQQLKQQLKSYPASTGDNYREEDYITYVPKSKL